MGYNHEFVACIACRWLRLLCVALVGWTGALMKSEIERALPGMLSSVTAKP